MADMVIELSDGSEVRLHEVWNCCDDIHDSGSEIEVYDNEDFDMNDFVECVEANL